MFGLIYSATMTTKETSRLTLPCFSIVPGFLFEDIGWPVWSPVDPKQHSVTKQ